jgi:hypothetical protein
LTGITGRRRRRWAGGQTDRIGELLCLQERLRSALNEIEQLPTDTLQARPVDACGLLSGTRVGSL